MKKSSALPTFVLSLALFLGVGAYLHFEVLPTMRLGDERLGRIEAKLAAVEDSIALMHFSRDPKGAPAEVILDYLEYWTEREAQYGSSHIERPVILEKMDRGTRALRALGPSAYDAVVAGFEATASDEKKIPYRKRLLKVLRALDVERAKPLCVAQLTTLGLHPEIRTTAGQMLLEIDKGLAGAKLRQIILNETYRGARHTHPAAGGGNVPKGLQFTGYPGFFNLVNLYKQSSDDGKTDVLLVVLNTTGHDVATMQAAVDGIIEKKSSEAVAPLKKIFEEPKYHVHRDPMLRRKILLAVVEIEGTLACSWLKERLGVEADQQISSLIGQFLNQYCGS